MDSPIESVEIAQALPESVIQTIDNWQEDSLYFIANNLYMNPVKVTDRTSLISRLMVMLEKSREELEPKFEIRKKRHLEIIRKMSVSTRDLITKRINAEKLALSSKVLSREDSIYYFLKIDDNLIRYYPEKTIGGQITGFVDGEGKGKYGIE